MISTDARRKLTDAVAMAADELSGGAAPNDAVVKAAKYYELHPSYLQPIVNAVNTAVVTQQRKSGSNLLERAANVPLADIGAVQTAIYGQSKQASFAPQAMLLCTPPAMHRNNADLKIQPGMTKIASACPKAPEVPLPEAKSRVFAVAETEKLAQVRGQRAIEAADVKYATELAAEKLEKLSNAISWTPGLELHVKAAHGDAGWAVWQTVSRGKQAMKAAFVSDDRMRAILGGIGDVLTGLAQYENAQKAAAAAETAWQESFRADHDRLRPTPVPVPRIVDDIFDKEAAFGLPFGIAAGNVLAKDVAEPAIEQLMPSRDRMVQDTLEKLTDPHHEAEMRNLRTQSVLHNMMLNDPIIGKTDPEHVTNAFNQIVATAPRLADQPLPLQTAMRSVLQQGQMDNFQIDQLLKAEKSLQSRDQGMYGERPTGPMFQAE